MLIRIAKQGRESHYRRRNQSIQEHEIPDIVSNELETANGDKNRDQDRNYGIEECMSKGEKDNRNHHREGSVYLRIAARHSSSSIVCLSIVSCGTNMN